MLVFLLILIVLLSVIAGIAQIVQNHTRLNREAKEQKLYSVSDRNDEHSFVRHNSRPIVHQCKAFGLRFALSADRKTAYLLYSRKENTLTVPASKITGCRIIREGHSLSLGGAVAGGLVAGDAGAIIGAASGAYIPLRYSLVIYLDDLSIRRVEYKLLTPSGSHAKSAYIAATRFAEEVSATVRSIAAQNLSRKISERRKAT